MQSLIDGCAVVLFRKKNPKQAANVGVHVFLLIDSKLACIPVVDLHL